VINRGVDRRRLFFSDDDYRGFEALIQDVYDEVPLPIKTYELMPNHWHFAVVPTEDDQVSRFFQLLAGTHAKRLRSKSKTIGDGHIYQDRFRSFSVEGDEHFIALCRYIERNALRAGLVSRAEDWPWGGLWKRLHSAPKWLDSGWCLPLSSDWVDRVNMPLTAAELAAIRQSIRTGRPWGRPEWTEQCAAALGLAASSRPRGRPRWPTF
jgi:putative transposase